MGDFIELQNVTLGASSVFTPKKSTDPAFANNPAQYFAYIMVPPGSPERLKLDNALTKKQQESGASLMPQIKPPPGATSERDSVRASAKSTAKILVQDRSNQKLFDESEIYPGVKTNVWVDVYYNQPYKRVCIGLLAVQKVADGPRLDNVPELNPQELFKPINVVNNTNPGGDPLG